MNSAEKKAPEPSMDDIISSIRNIIADDTQESPPAAPVSAAENGAASVVKLTENQISEPVAAVADAPVPEPEPVAEVAAPTEPPQPAIADPFDDLQVANEIDAVPGATMAPESPEPVVAEAPVPEAVQTAPAPAAVLQGEVPSQMAAPAPVPVDAQPEPVTPEISEPVVSPLAAAVAPEVAAAPSAPEVAAVEPEVIPLAGMEVEAAKEEGVHLDDVPFTESEQSEPVEADPVAEVMQVADAQSNNIDPDVIVEDMDVAPMAVEAMDDTPAPVEEVQAMVAEPEPLAASPDVIEPVILDASQVTPEDAAAITAVAAATSEALAGTTSQPVQKTTGNTLEDSIKAMLKPMIREWLDDNMPRILEGAIMEDVQNPDDDV